MTSFYFSSRTHSNLLVHISHFHLSENPTCLLNSRTTSRSTTFLERRSLTNGQREEGHQISARSVSAGQRDSTNLRNVGSDGSCSQDLCKGRRNQRGCRESLLQPCQTHVLRLQQYRYNCKVQDECGLSKLPAELQRWIWSYLVLPADRLMLALTCKSHAAVFEELKGNTQKKSSAPKKSEKAVAGPRSTTRSSPIRNKPATKPDKLYVLYRLQGWMSTKYRLCYECVRFRKKIRSIRKGALTCAVKDSWSGTKFTLATEKDHDEQEIMKELRDKIKTGSRCPECCERARLATVSAKKCHRDLKELLAKTL